MKYNIYAIQTARDGSKSIPKKIIKTTSIEENKQSYAPPKKSKKTKIKDNNNKEVLTLVENAKEESVNETLVLDTLAAENNPETKEEKYIPPKTKKNLF